MHDRGQALSMLVALAGLAAIGQREGWAGVLALLPLLAIALGMIWYAGSICRAIGNSRGLRRFDRPTPPAAVRMLGWVLLLAPLLILVMLQLRSA